MVRFVFSRLGQTLAVLFTVSVIIFALMRMIPGDPVLMRLGDDFTQAAYDRLRGELGFDRSIVVQYLIWIRDVLSGDLGDSFLNHERVSKLVLDAFIPTLTLVVASVIVGILIAVPSASSPRCEGSLGTTGRWASPSSSLDARLLEGHRPHLDLPTCIGGFPRWATCTRGRISPRASGVSSFPR
jgi:ABC-type microcin C transport system permease subunit YejB